MLKPITGATGSEQEEANRRLVFGFYENVIINRQFDRWPEYWRTAQAQHPRRS